MPRPTLRPLFPVVLVAALLAAPALALDPPEGATTAFGTGVIEVSTGGQLVCTDLAAIAIAVVFGEAEVGDVAAPTGYYASSSSCATFAYPIDTEYDCTGAPGAAIHCTEYGPPRSFDLAPDGSFLYVRDNLGIHFEVRGQLARHDVQA